MSSPDPEIVFNLHNDDQINDRQIPQSSANEHNDIDNSDNESVSSVETVVSQNSMESRNGHNSRYNSNDHNYHQYSNMRHRSNRSNSNNCGDYYPQYTQSAPLIQSIKPDSYDGSQSFDQYLSHFEDCSELAHWDYRTRVLVLAASLRGAARTYYMSLTENERRDYNILVLRLRNRFGHTKHQALWLNKLDNRKRQRGESIASLGDDLRQLSQKAYSDLDPTAQEKLALNQFYRSLSTDMKCRCVDKNCKTVSEAVSVVEKYECILGAQNASVRSLETSRQPEQTPESLLAEIKRLEAKINSLEAKDKKAVYNNDRTGRTCFGCNSSYHLWKNCPRNNQNRHKSGVNSSYSGQARNPTPSHNPSNYSHTRNNNNYNNPVFQNDQATLHQSGSKSHHQGN